MIREPPFLWLSGFAQTLLSIHLALAGARMAVVGSNSKKASKAGTQRPGRFAVDWPKASQPACITGHVFRVLFPRLFQSRRSTRSNSRASPFQVQSCCRRKAQKSRRDNVTSSSPAG